MSRLGDGPEARLAADYVTRAGALGRSLGFSPIELIERETRGQGRPRAAAASAIPEGAHLIACDEHGQGMTSTALAARLAALRDGGERRLAFLVGGPDGLGDALLAAHERLAFGPQTWPHALFRVMLAEQVYRALTILAGTPYHRS